LVSTTGSGYLRPLLEETTNGIIITILITLPSDIHGNNMSEECFFSREKKKTDKQKEFIVNPGHKIATQTAILRNPNLSIDLHQNRQINRQADDRFHFPGHPIMHIFVYLCAF